jgi:DNA modification methylase
MISILQGDWISRLLELEDKSIQCIVTSPPYWGLRDYGVKGQLGLEKTPEKYVANMVAGFREAKRVLRMMECFG